VSEPPLHCPGCAREYPASERFCDACGMPLVHGGEDDPEPTERQRRARKIKPEYSQGRLVKVGRAANQPEAELIEVLLLEEGIPSMQRRSGGVDVPDAPGPRDILVPESGAEAAREALAPQQP
jgi:Putative prokaryotic signal transducing protein